LLRVFSFRRQQRLQFASHIGPNTTRAPPLLSAAVSTRCVGYRGGARHRPRMGRRDGCHRNWTARAAIGGLIDLLLEAEDEPPG